MGALSGESVRGAAGYAPLVVRVLGGVVGGGGFLVGRVSLVQRAS